MQVRVQLCKKLNLFYTFMCIKNRLITLLEIRFHQIEHKRQQQQEKSQVNNT